jgi:hypothetical protein
MVSKTYRPERIAALNPTARPNEIFKWYRKSRIPVGGWTQESFKATRGRKLLKDVLAVRKLALRENITKMNKAVTGMFEDEINMIMEDFIAQITTDHVKSTKSIGSNLMLVILNLRVPDGSESLWEAALDRVFEEGSVLGRVMRVFKPSYQSTISHIVEKTNVLLVEPSPVPEVIDTSTFGQPLPVTAIEVTTDRPLPRPMVRKEQAALINRKADKLCRKVTRISKTSRRRMRIFFEEHIKAGDTVKEMIEAMKREFPRVAKDRAARIVRNELSVAANEAQIMSFVGSRSVTHCSVIGCQAVEDNSPTFRGFHTCNLRNVPVGDLDEVEFHIGHTGSWIPTGFRLANGTVPRLVLHNTEGIGSYDDPNARRHRS